MKYQFTTVDGSVCVPQGFRASGVFCDIKRLGTGKGSNKGPKRDLSLIVSEAPAVVAGLFTTNQVCAAPVKVCLERVRKGSAQAIVANSGNANACTGKQGLADAREMADFTERALKLPRGSVLVASTGRIGVSLPMDNVRAGIIEAAVELGSDPDHASASAEAIMTSDTRQKQVALEFRLGGRAVRIGGICKGAGMIQPGMSASGRRPPASAARHDALFPYHRRFRGPKSFAERLGKSSGRQFHSDHRGRRYEYQRHGAYSGKRHGRQC
jgi:glutamate N-acetyltransferase/amino-acid N-acetyltransferase